MDYPKGEVVAVSKVEAMEMMLDPNIIVIMAEGYPKSEPVTVTYWRNERGMLPPWLRPAAASPTWVCS